MHQDGQLLAKRTGTEQITAAHLCKHPLHDRLGTGHPAHIDHREVLVIDRNSQPDTTQPLRTLSSVRRGLCGRDWLFRSRREHGQPFVSSPMRRITVHVRARLSGMRIHCEVRRGVIHARGRGGRRVDRRPSDTPRHRLLCHLLISLLLCLLLTLLLRCRHARGEIIRPCSGDRSWR